jgi:hypothetical protein
MVTLPNRALSARPGDSYVIIIDAAKPERGGSNLTKLNQ